MNTWGRCFRLHIYGESHGHGVGVLVDGCPAGVSLSEKDFEEDLLRRKPQGALGTPRREEDRPSIGSGLFEGRTTGAPLLLSFLNKDTRSSDYSSVLSQPRAWACRLDRSTKVWRLRRLQRWRSFLGQTYFGACRGRCGSEKATSSAVTTSGSYKRSGRRDRHRQGPL